SDRFDGLLEDVFELQDRMAKRIAEALRVELSNLIYRGEAPAEAVELYLRARQNIKSLQLGKDNADFVEMLERCLELAPEFKPALATHALGCLREWFSPIHDDDRDWGALTRKSVQRALDQAPELADTHYASARLSVQLGEYRQAAQGLARALEIAPTCAEYHEYLGRLQCEAGRTKIGVRHILLAHELDPSLNMGLIDLARTHALRGEWEGYNKTLREIRTRMGTQSVAAQLTQTRVSSWIRDVDAIRNVVDNLPEGELNRIFLHCRALLCSETALKRFIEVGESLSKRPDANLRFLTVTYQMGAEVMAFHKKYDRALEFISRAADAVLVDIDWMKRCPLFDEIRETPEFRSAAQKVRHRAEAIWRVSVEIPALAAG
ncbi:MAG: tetratricopeptide repeat protein, partial [Nannocystaceae bacterium]